MLPYLLKDQRRNDGALKTIKNKTLTIVGPIKLIQNNRMAIIARKPIFSKVSGKEQFWGFTIVLIYIEDLLPESLLKLENQGILYQIVGDDPDSGFPPILKSSETISDHWDYILPIEMANGSWQLKLSSNKLIPDNFAQFRLFGMTLALVFGLLFYRQQKNGLTRSLKIEYLNTDLTLTTHELLDEKEKLQKAIEEIKTLQGIIPICSHCHKIRNDDQIWDRLETYLSENTDAKLSHGICPECLKEHYPDFQNDD